MTSAVRSVLPRTRSTLRPGPRRWTVGGCGCWGEVIRPGSDSTTVRVREGKVLLTDGPYAETKDVIAGFDVLDCADLDEAVEVASKHPMARNGVLELRPSWEED